MAIQRVFFLPGNWGTKISIGSRIPLLCGADSADYRKANNLVTVTYGPRVIFTTSDS